jgi:hypothetical protein
MSKRPTDKSKSAPEKDPDALLPYWIELFLTLIARI